jgi:putative SOS response-associated peptidase YedK
MCNDYSNKLDITQIEKLFGTSSNIPKGGRTWSRARTSASPTGRRSSAPPDRVTNSSSVAGAGRAPGGKPVYNFRSDGREFGSGRCLIPADGFYEFTMHSDPKSKRKHKWRFTLKGAEWFGIAGIWRIAPDVEEAFTMLTTEPGPDIAPYHNRQIVVLAPADFTRWLDPSVPARDLLKPLPAGSLQVQQIC